MNSPAGDQATARLRDLQRLRELIHPHTTSPHAPVTEALARMPPGDAAEARSILARLGTIGENPEKTTARREALLRLADYEVLLRDIITHGQPGTRRARRVMADLEQLRARLTGLPPDTTANDSDNTTPPGAH